MKKLYQQGDVLLTTEEVVPEGCKRISPTERGIVLAEGEATGHAHTISDVGTCSMWEDPKTSEKWIKTDKKVTIQHQEHHAITIPKGTYRLGIVREVDPFLEEIRKVQD